MACTSLVGDDCVENGNVRLEVGPENRVDYHWSSLLKVYIGAGTYSD